MRFPRAILLGLSPLLSLWALSAQVMSASPQDFVAHSAERRLSADALQQFIQPVVSFLLFAAEQASSHPAQTPRSPQANLGFEGLASSPLVASIWLVRDERPFPIHAHRHLSPLLRC